MKAIRSNRNISPYGGAVPILKKIKEFGIPQVIRKCLGNRVEQSKYGYEDIFISWVLTSLCGGTRLDHITKLRKKLNIIPNLKIPSHDTIGRAMKKLATETLTQRNISTDKVGKINFTDYNDNENLARMLIQATKRMGALNDHRAYTLDIDATFIPTECRGAKRKLNEKNELQTTKIGFSPMVCLIGDLPVYISMRDGNAAARFQLHESLANCLRLLKDSNIKIGRVISDAAGYHIKALAMLDDTGIKFNIRFPYQKKHIAFNFALKDKASWRSTRIETANSIWDCEVADIEHAMFRHYKDPDEAKTYRVVAVRMPTLDTLEKTNPELWEQITKNKRKMDGLAVRRVTKECNKPSVYQEGSWKEIDGYFYKFFLTNDFKRSSEEIVLEYNKRGNAERKFSFLKNDFAWRLPPFSNMNENTVFLIASALANNIFRGMLRLVKKFAPGLTLNSRFPEFKYIFIDVACSYIGRGIFKFYNTDIEFEKIM